MILFAGLALAALCCVAASLGAFAPLERASLDARFRLAQPETRALSDDIRLIEIDDGAIESVGRWPWARSLLADAIHELALAGAQTVALDLLLDDPSELDWLPAPGEEEQTVVQVDHDASLAHALAETTAVLALDAPFDLDDFERTVAGDADARRAINLLRVDFDATSEPDALVPEDVSLRRLRFVAALGKAVERRASLPADAPDDEEALIRALAPRRGESVGDFPERRLIERAASHARSLSIVAGALSLRLPTQPDALDALHLARVTPPAPPLAFGASSFGFVNFNADPDGSPRRMPLRRPSPMGDLPQFGLAAAAAFAGIDPSTVRVDTGAVEFAGRRLPLRDGRLLVSWPSPRAYEDGAHEQRMSLGVLISMAKNRRTLERLHAQRVVLAAAIQNIDKARVSDETLGSVRDLVALRLAEVRDLLDAGEALTEQEREYLAPYERFDEVERAIVAGVRELAAADAELARRVRGRLCFVGWSASGALADFVPTPLADRTPGVVVHAAIADSLLTGRAKSLPPAWFGPALAFAAAMLGALLVLSLPTPHSAGSFVAAAFGYLAFAGYVAFRFGDVALPLAAPVASLTVAWALCTALDAAASRAERARIQRQFKSRVAPQLVERLAANPDALAVDGEAREITVLFLDVAGFTSLSERLDGPQTVALINDCMRAFTAELTRADAYVNKFLGDGLMAFWSAFAPDPDQADKAVRAAAACLDAIERVNAQRRALDPDSPPLSVRVGVATGVAIVGDCGAPPDLNDYTAIGNAVNLASRLEGACKAFGVRAMIDGRTRDLLRQPPPRPLRRLGRVVVVGQTVPVEVFEVPREPVPEARLARWVDLAQRFERGEFDECLDALAGYTRDFGDEPPCERLREAIEDLRAAGEPFSTPVAIRLRSK